MAHEVLISFRRLNYLRFKHLSSLQISKTSLEHVLANECFFFAVFEMRTLLQKCDSKLFIVPCFILNNFPS